MAVVDDDLHGVLPHSYCTGVPIVVDEMPVGSNEIFVEQVTDDEDFDDEQDYIELVDLPDIPIAPPSNAGGDMVLVPPGPRHSQCPSVPCQC